MGFSETLSYLISDLEMGRRRAVESPLEKQHVFVGTPIYIHSK